MNVQNIELIIEKGEDDRIWGRVTFNKNLIIEQSNSLDGLELKLKVLLNDLEGVDVEKMSFDVTIDAGI